MKARLGFTYRKNPFQINQSIIMLSSLKHVHTLKCVVRKNQSNDNFTIRLFQYLFMFHDPTYLPTYKKS